MKIQLVQISENHKQNLIRSFNHSEEIIIQRTRVKIIDRFSGKLLEMFSLEGLGQLAWVPIETTGNHEIFAQVFVGPPIELDEGLCCKSNNVTGKNHNQELFHT